MADTPSRSAVVGQLILLDQESMLVNRSATTAAAVLAASLLGLIPASAGFVDWIFGDSFEGGNPSAWSQSFGTLQVVPEAASEGLLGLRAHAAASQSGWVQHDSVSDELVLRADFDFNGDSLDVPTGESFELLIGWFQEDALPAFALSVGNDGGGLGLRLTAFEADATPVPSAVVPLGEPGWHRIGVEFGSGTGPGGTGEARLFLDGLMVAELSDFDNDGITVKSARLGFARDPGQEISGSLDVDVYTAVRLFDPWPCVVSSGADPIAGQPVCLDGEGLDTAIATGGCGDGLVVWTGAEDLDRDRGLRSRLGGIYGKKVSGASGRGADPTFVIDADETAETPDLDADAACRAVVVWKENTQVDVIAARVVAFDGTPLSNQIPVAASGAVEEQPSVGVDAAGDFLVVWRRQQQGEESIWARHFASDGTPSDPEFEVDDSSRSISAPSVATNGQGDSVVAWSVAGEIRAALVDSAGQLVQYVLVADTGLDSDPSAAMLEDGSFAVAWIREASDRGVFVRRFDASGQPLGAEVRLDSLLPGNCSDPHAAAGPGDVVVVVWTSLHDGVQTIRGRTLTPSRQQAGAEFVVETAGRVWRPERPQAAAAERLVFSFSEVTEPGGFGRGSLVGALELGAGVIFADGFEDGSTGAWSDEIP